MALLREQLRPAEVPADRLVACLGLISDTHFPERLAALPAAVFDVFRGVDLVLHASDIGTLDVLDRLSAAAPVVAVHGNDERYPEAQRELPYQQVLMLGGHRIVQATRTIPTTPRRWSLARATSGHLSSPAAPPLATAPARASSSTATPTSPPTCSTTACG